MNNFQYNILHLDHCRSTSTLESEIYHQYRVLCMYVYLFKFLRVMYRYVFNNFHVFRECLCIFVYI